MRAMAASSCMCVGTHVREYVLGRATRVNRENKPTNQPTTKLFGQIKNKISLLTSFCSCAWLLMPPPPGLLLLPIERGRGGRPPALPPPGLGLPKPLVGKGDEEEEEEEGRLAGSRDMVLGSLSEPASQASAEWEGTPAKVGGKRSWGVEGGMEWGGWGSVGEPSHAQCPYPLPRSCPTKPNPTLLDRSLFALFSEDRLPPGRSRPCGGR